MNLLAPLLDHDAGGRRLPIPPGVNVCPIYGGPNNRYRYWLGWDWNLTRPCLVAGMMNPSCADHDCADSTLIWVYRWACSNDFGRLVVVNADAYRCRDQVRLAEVEDPCGPDNARAIREAAEIADLIVVGYGQPKVKAVRGHGARMVDVMRQANKPIHAWALAKNGTPKHPLYLPADTAVCALP